MFKLREIQEQKSTELKKVVRKHRIGILAGEVRSGKTLTVLETAEKLRKKHDIDTPLSNVFSALKRNETSKKADTQTTGSTIHE